MATHASILVGNAMDKGAWRAQSMVLQESDMI